MLKLLESDESPKICISPHLFNIGSDESPKIRISPHFSNIGSDEGPKITKNKVLRMHMLWCANY